MGKKRERAGVDGDETLISAARPAGDTGPTSRLQNVCLQCMQQVRPIRRRRRRMHGFYEAGNNQLRRQTLDPVSPENDPGKSEDVDHRVVQGEYIEMDQENEEGENAKGANIPTRPTK